MEWTVYSGRNLEEGAEVEEVTGARCREDLPSLKNRLVLGNDSMQDGGVVRLFVVSRLDQALTSKGGENNPGRSLRGAVRGGVVWATTEATDDGINLFSQDEEM